MTKLQLEAAVNAAKEETRDAIQTVYEALNHGQRKQIVKKEKVKQLFERYGVAYEDGESV